MTALVPLAALGLQEICRALSGRRRWFALPAAIVLAATAVSFVELAIPPAEKRFRTVPVPPEYAAVERTPPGILAEYPLGYSDIYRLWQQDHGRALLNGGRADTPADQARLVLLDPAEPGTAAALSLLGVTAIGIHPAAHVDAEVAPRDPVDEPGYRLVGRFSNGASVWQVVARPAAAFVTLPGGFAKPQRTEDGAVGYALISPAGVGVIQLHARTRVIARLSFDAVPPNGEQRVLRVTDADREQAFTLSGRKHVSVLVEIPRGQSQLLLKTDPPPASAAEAIVITAPHAEPFSGEPTLRATRISPDPGF
jgi:hypothetical protein